MGASTNHNPIRAALYARISTAKEREEQNIETQLLELRKFAKTHEWKVTHEFKDYISGSKDRRPELDKLMKAAAKREFDYVVVYDLSRLTRGGIAKAFDIIDRLNDCGVEFWSMTQEHFRTTGRNGRLLIAIAAHIAEEERLQFSTRIRSGIARRKASGHQVGPKKRVVNMLKLIALRDQGKTLREIAHDMKVDKTTIMRRLRDVKNATMLSAAREPLHQLT